MLVLSRQRDETIMIGDDIEIESGDATKGDLKVFRKGKELVGASVLYGGAVLFDSNIYIGEGTVVEPGALIKGPSIIGNHTEVRQGAYLRGNCLIGDRCVVGHTTEVKHSIMLDDAKAGHFAYIGDSILGNHVNLGAGTKIANLRLDKKSIYVTLEGIKINTNRRKFGAIIGDDVQTGINATINVGTSIGNNSFIGQGAVVNGEIAPNSKVM